MASYHLTAKIGAKGKAAPHAAYISREGKYSGRERYEDLEATDAGNMPKWAEHNPAHFWNAADEHERANGSTYREIEVALPCELTPDQRRELVEDFVKQELGDHHAYQWAIHTPKAALDKGDQPHAHIMYSERTRDGLDRDPEQYFKRYNAKQPERGGAQKASGGKARAELKAELQVTRQRWAEVQNAHLERHGHAARVDHRSLKERGIDREPEKHLGGAGVRKLTEQDLAALLERRAAEGERERLQRMASSIINLSGDLAAARAERDQRQAAEQQRQAEAAAERNRKPEPAPEVKQAAASGVADFRAQFELNKQVEAGKAQALEAFQRFKAEQQAQQRQAELAKQLAEQREKQRAEREAKKPERDGPG